MPDPNEILVAPLGTLVAQVADGVAKAQLALDRSSLAVAKSIADDEELAAIGYQPTFYAIPEVVAEIKITIHLEESGTRTAGGGKRGPRLYALPFNARTQTAFKQTTDGQSSLRVRIVPVPAPIGERGQ